MVRDVPGVEKPEQTCGVLQVAGDMALVVMKVNETHHMRWVPILPLVIISPIPQQMNEEETEDNEKARALSDLGGGEQEDSEDDDE